MFRAEDEEEEEEKQEKLALLREQQQRRRRRRRETAPPATSTYTRAIEIPCGNKNKNGDDASEDGSSSASEVMFALKVSRPGRLVPRRNRSSISSGWVRRHRGRGNHSTSNSKTGGLNQPRSFNGVVAMPSDMSLMSLFEESMTFRQEQEQQRLLEEEKQEEEPTDLDNDDLLLDELLRDDLPPSPSQPLMGDFSQTCCHNNNNNNNHNLSNSTNMNHDSFQSTEEGTIHPQHKRTNKMRKIMMNWLANQVATRHLLAAGSSSSSTTSASSVTTPFVPPTFVKVIYWNDNENQLHINNKQQQWNHHHHHHGNNANHDDSLQPTMIGLDQSHHNNVASAMA